MNGLNFHERFYLTLRYKQMIVKIKAIPGAEIDISGSLKLPPIDKKNNMTVRTAQRTKPARAIKTGEVGETFICQSIDDEIII